MIRIGLISDTHGYLDENVFKHLEKCDEIWHAGDFGSIEIANRLASSSPLRTGSLTVRGVYGNIDGNDVRSIYPEKLFWKCEEVNVFMKHIGGYPKHYAPGVKDDIIKHQSQLFISGHSHILKIIYDDKLNCLHMNPGAAGKQGWQKVRTIVRFAIDGKNIKDSEVIELSKK
ncbi:MAG: metallophosphatase family protein [Bacteroidota bacterium]|nr:metallophosphatase family protein [Bacteroidota bacterium]